MGGSPSAPDSGPDSLEFTERSSRPSDIERELDGLRARAYGPDADIDADPAALARLVELEAAHLGAARAARSARPAAVATAVTVTPGEPTGPSSSQGGSRGVPGRTWVVAAAICLFAIVAATVWNLVQRPDATLRQTDAGGGSDVIRVLSAQGRGPDASTLRQFEPYHDVGVWSVENAAGKVCFVVWDLTSSGRFSIKCAPPGTQVTLTLIVASDGDDFGRWLPDGSSVDFRFGENAVDVFVRPPSD
ncbi:hypothetical protein ACWKWN_12445 [Microbacterium trichothecenolyticum]